MHGGSLKRDAARRGKKLSNDILTLCKTIWVTTTTTN